MTNIPTWADELTYYDCDELLVHFIDNYDAHLLTKKSKIRYVFNLIDQLKMNIHSLEKYRKLLELYE